MDVQKTIDCLNTLIIINNDRIEGYQTAQKETDNIDLNKLFSDFQSTSFNCKSELVVEVKKLNGEPNQGTRVTGKFFRVWMDVKSALTGNNKKFILESCLYGENVALEVYKDILIQHIDETSKKIQDLLNKQYALLKENHETIQNLLNNIQ
ncbi:MAG: PA2169 family four-helix-bundle protein [Flavobacterium sp.]|nr:PA2169 family four-helix-bundle protein [Flavobacterium sp.]